MSESESKLNAEAIVYFVISPLEGPAYRICGDDDLQAIGGVHALERRLENESYWFARMASRSRILRLAKLPEPPEGTWQTGRLNPAFRQSDIEKRAFQEVFQAIQRMLDSWRTTDGTTVESFALKELKISAPRLVSLTTGLCALKKVHEFVEVTAVKFWYDSLWLSKPVPSDELVLAEYSFRIPLQLRWAADHRLISVQILRTASC
jgi:hypothetical protein